MDHPHAQMPSDVHGEPGIFDRFAGWASSFASRAPFFAFCVLLVIVWGPSYFVFNSIDTWQLVINTLTTIVTFLLVALLQNTQTRADQATQHKLNAIADGLADLMEHLANVADEDIDCDDLLNDAKELKEAVGLENRETTTKSKAA